MLARPSKDERTHPSSHTNYSVLSTPDKEERLHRSHLETKKRKLREDRLMEKICVAASNAEPLVDESLDTDLRSMASENTNLVNSTYTYSVSNPGYVVYIIYELPTTYIVFFAARSIAGYLPDN